jgi:peptide/nickel transport system permease protein
MSATSRAPDASLHAWLTAEVTHSARQARGQRLYFAWLRLRRNRLAFAGCLFLIVLLLVAAVAPALAPYGFNDQDLQHTLAPPSAAHPFGTDDLGRDVLSRVLVGARVTLMITCLVAVIATPIGLAVGTTAGYVGGWTDIVLMRISDLFLALPGLILALGFVAALGPGIRNAIVAIAVTAWPAIARLARAETLTIRRSDYIAATRLLGASRLRIILRHVVPLCLPSVIVRVTLNMSTIILVAAGLGFLGLGAQPPMAEWGAMLSAGQQHLQAWWISTAPGVAILLTSLAFNLVGDGLRDVLDPRE